MANNSTYLPVLASAARTTTQTGSDIANILGYKGIRVTLDTTAASSGSVTLTIQSKDVASGTYSTLLAGAAVTTVTTNVYTVYPNIAVTANVSASMVLPDIFRILVTANNANTQTYSVGAVLLA